MATIRAGTRLLTRTNERLAFSSRSCYSLFRRTLQQRSTHAQSVCLSRSRLFTSRTASPTLPLQNLRQYATAAAAAEEGQTVQPPDFLDEKEKSIFLQLRGELNPTALEVQDVSGGCGSMYAVAVTSEKFRGLSVIKQHRLVNEILKEKIKDWHGLQLRTKAP